MFSNPPGRAPARAIAAGLAATLATTLIAGSASAAPLRVSVTNLAPVGGFSLTPLYVALHDGSFDAFDRGAPASPGVELLAETGFADDITPERLDAAPGSQAAMLGAPQGFAGAPVVEPGETTTATLDVDPANRFLTFLSMILPSNDTFIGNDDATAFEIFDASGAFTGPQTIDITGAFITDAGTEVNDPDLGPAFTVGEDITEGALEGGVVAPGESLLNFAGMVLPNGQTLDGSLIDYTGDPDGFQVARITVSEVPLPPALGLLAGAMALLGLGGMRRRIS